MTAQDPEHDRALSRDQDRDRDRDQHAERGRPTGSAIPETGEPDVDRALESLQGLESAPLDEHHDRLAQVHEELHRALNRHQDQA